MLHYRNRKRGPGRCTQRRILGRTLIFILNMQRVRYKCLELTSLSSSGKILDCGLSCLSVSAPRLLFISGFLKVVCFSTFLSLPRQPHLFFGFKYHLKADDFQTNIPSPDHVAIM